VIARIHHVGVAVRSLEAAYPFWREALGLPLVREAEVPEQGVRAALLACGPAEVELVEPTAPEGGVARFVQARGEGLHHLCFESDDVGREVKRFWATGVQMIDAQPRPGLAGLVAFVHPKACGGVLVEMTTPSDRAPLPASPLAMAAVHIVAENLRTSSQLYRDLFGLAVQRVGPEDRFVQLAVGGVTVQLASREPTAFPVGLSALRLAAGSLDTLARRVAARGIASRAWSGGLQVGPANSSGVPLIIETKRA
jgi:methylmalonyl-CoA/ethylmalonyl-CoA epimerase